MMFSVDVFTMRRVKIMKVFALWKQDDRTSARLCVCMLCVCVCEIRSEMKTILRWAIKNKRANAMGEKG